jgi:WD40 repeat protein
VSAGHDGRVRVWKLGADGPRGYRVARSGGWVMALAVGELGGRGVIVSGGYDRSVRVWDFATRAPRGRPLTGHRGRVSAVAVGKLSGRPVMATGDTDGTVRVWSQAGATDLAIAVGSSVADLAIGPENMIVFATASGMAAVKVEQPTSGPAPRTAVSARSLPSW